MLEINTKLHACSIESLGVDGIYACGTYELNEAESVRLGEIVIFKGLEILCSVSCPSGILDMKYSHGKLCVVLSTGCLTIYDVVFGDNTVVLNLLTSIDAEDDEGLFLSLDIDRRLNTDCWVVETNIAVSTQMGSILIYRYIPAVDTTSTCQLQLRHRVASAHNMLKENMPAWIVFFDPHAKNRLISGGDDCILRMWDLPYKDNMEESTEEEEEVEVASLHPIGKNSKSHTAGVTSGQWHPTISDIFATGSYDEYVRVWDQGNLAKPLLEIHTGGGVWRAKWFIPNIPNGPHYLILACMHGGCNIYQLQINSIPDQGSWECFIIKNVHHIDDRNPQHLAYGIDLINSPLQVAELTDSSNNNTNSSNKDTTIVQYELKIASCSFYDNLVQLWQAIL